MAGKYISSFTGAQIDEAIMKALMYNPNENGWVKLPSTEESPISLDELISIGNYVVDYIIDGPFYYENGIKTEILKDTHPINISVVSIDGVLTQYIMILDDIYYREFNDDNGLYNEDWFSKKTTNFIYINDQPENPEKNAIIIIPDINSSESDPRYTMKIYDGEKYIDVYPSGVMQKSVYDTQGREIDFFQYVDDTFQAMNNTTLGIAWNDTDFTDLVNTEVNSSITVNDDVIITFKNSSKILCYSLLDQTKTVYNLPLICISPEIFNLNKEGKDYYYIYDRESLNLLHLDFNSEGLVTTPIIISGNDGSVSLNHFIGIIHLGYNTLNNINIDVLSDDGYIYKVNVNDKNATLNIDNKEYWNGVDYFLSITGEKYELYDKASNSGYMTYYETESLKSYIKVEDMVTTVTIIDNIDDVETIRTGTIDTNETFVAISNIIDIFGDYAGYVITSSGVVYSVQSMFEDVFLMRTYQANSLINWKSISYNINSLALYGSSNDVVSNHILLTTQDSSLLNLVEDHLNNSDIHFSELDRKVLQTRETITNVNVRLNRIEKDIKNQIDRAINNIKVDYDDLNKASKFLDKTLTDHINDNDIHPTEEMRNSWSDKAEKNHTHILDGNVKIDASQIVSGMIPIERIPDGAKEEIFKVDTIEDMYKMTIEDVQNGDRISVFENGIYEVIDETKLAYIDEETSLLVLATSDAFMECGAGSSAYIDWKNVEKTPNTLAGYGITDSFTKDETEEIYQTKVNELVSKLEGRYTTFDIAELYSIAKASNVNINKILSEMDDAIEASRNIQRQDEMIKELRERITLLSSDLEECESISDTIINLFS